MSEHEIDSDFAFDPLDLSRIKDAGFLATLRRERPVCRPAEGIVLTTRYHDTVGVFRDPKRFSSSGDMRAPGVVVAESERFLGEIDPPLHPKIRLLLARSFSQQRALAVESWTRASVQKRLEALATKGGGDLMHDFAVPLPVSSAAHVVGFSDELHDPFVRWCDDLVHSTWPALGKTERGEGITGAFPEFAATLDEEIQRRQATPRDDLLSRLLHHEAKDGWRIPAEHIRTLSINMMSGALSASYMIGNLLYRYLDDSDFAATLRADPSQIPAAIEESLRFESPVVFLFRTAKETTQVGGRTVRAGEHVMLGIASANRDETVFPQADSYLLQRENASEHIAFGIGPHVCLGNQLSRMVARVVLEETIARFEPAKIALADDFKWECVGAVHEWGPETLDVRIHD